MKLQRIRLGEGDGLGILRNFEHQFSTVSSGDIEPLCLVGQNGTGKSRLLQCLAEIFYDLDNRARNEGSGNRNYPVTFTYELEYLLQDGPKEVSVKVSLKTAKGKPKIETKQEGKWHEVPLTEIGKFLPDRVVGYTSGQNETLSWPFLEGREEYAKAVTEAALYDREEKLERYLRPRLEMVDYSLNLAVLVSMFLLKTGADKEAFSDLAKFARIEELESLRFVIRRNHQAAKKIGGVKFTQQLDRYVDNFRKCCTCYDHDVPEDSWIFDFQINDETRRALQIYFASPWALFAAFQRLEMLNYLMVDKHIRKEHTKERRRSKLCEPPPQPASPEKVFEFKEVKFRLTNAPDEPADYIMLSDGEHQLAHIFCTLRMFREGNVLFLLDEPESHFNPLWRVEFVKMANKFLSTDNGAHALILSTHAVFVISDCRKENVYVFRRKADGRTVEVVKPQFQTYGASFDWLLEQIFQVKPPIARKALDDLAALRKENPAVAEQKLEMFGESFEKIRTMEFLTQSPKAKA